MYQNTEKWLPYLTKKLIAQNLDLFQRGFTDKSRQVRFRLTDNNYSYTALFLPQQYWKEAQCKAQDSIFRDHNATLKT